MAMTFSWIRIPQTCRSTIKNLIFRYGTKNSSPPPLFELGGSRMDHKFSTVAHHRSLSFENKAGGGGGADSDRIQPACPWLVLPPIFNGGDMVYNFYSLADNNILTFNKRRDGGGDDPDQIPPDGAELAGSSHGWLASYEKKSRHVFLSNPVSGRHMKLPPAIQDMWLSRVILTCSPDEEECRAVHVREASSTVPRVGKEWTPVERESYEEYLPYDDFAYCSRRKVVSCITVSRFKFDLGCVGVDSRYPHHQIDDWNLGEGERIETTWFWKYEGGPHSWKENEDAELLTKNCYQKLRLVYAERCFDLPLVVVWFWAKESPHKTAGFVVVQIEKRGNDCRKGSIKVVEDLKGLAVFVGEKSQTFAVPASDYPGILKPNSIYIARAHTSGFGRDEKKFSDVGVFDYEKKSFAAVYDHNYSEGGSAQDDVCGSLQTTLFEFVN